MATQADNGKVVKGQLNKGLGAVKNVGAGPNPPVVQKAGATQPGPKGKFSAGKK